MLDTDPTARVDELEHDLADLDEVELPLEPHQNGGSASITEDEATAAVAAVLAPPVEEPTQLGDLEAAAIDGLGARQLPIPPVPILKRKVYGRYRSSGTPYQVELRVDVDGPSPTMRISADYYAISGGPSRTSARCAWTHRSCRSPRPTSSSGAPPATRGTPAQRASR